MTDPRSVRSREALRVAFMQLLDEKSFEKITVREVLERAGLSKKAFYNHYLDINALAADCYHAQLLNFGNLGPIPSEYEDAESFLFPFLENSAKLFDFFRAHPRFARLITANLGASPYYQATMESEIGVFVSYLTDRFGRRVGRPAVDEATVARFVSGGWIGIIQGWIEDGMTESSEALSKKCQILINQCVGILAGSGIDEEYLAAIDRWRYTG